MMHKIRSIGIREQGAWLRTAYPGFRYEVKSGLLVCNGNLQPGPENAIYEVRIEYRMGRWPKTYVPGGQLQPRQAGGKIPHTYGPDRPCLFYPDRTSWRSDMKLADTIIPWLSLWLKFYEIWRVTGEWLGGGITHGVTKELEEAA